MARSEKSKARDALYHRMKRMEAKYTKSGVKVTWPELDYSKMTIKQMNELRGAKLWNKYAVIDATSLEGEKYKVTKREADTFLKRQEKAQKVAKEFNRPTFSTKGISASTKAGFKRYSKTLVKYANPATYRREDKQFYINWIQGLRGRPSTERAAHFLASWLEKNMTPQTLAKWYYGLNDGDIKAAKAGERKDTINELIIFSYRTQEMQAHYTAIFESLGIDIKSIPEAVIKDMQRFDIAGRDDDYYDEYYDNPDNWSDMEDIDDYADIF